MKIDMSTSVRRAQNFDKLVEQMMYDPEFDCGEAVTYAVKVYIRDHWEILKDTPLFQKHAKTKPDKNEEEIEPEIDDPVLAQLIREIQND